MRNGNLDYKCHEQGKKCGYTGYIENGPKIPTLAVAGGTKRVVGRIIKDTNRYMGSYGMGGPGFFGFCLEATDKYPEEWLVLALWSADQWLLLDGKWLDCYPDYFDLNKCYFPKQESNFSKANEQVKNVFNGFTIKKFVLKKKSFRMHLLLDTQTHILELPSNLTKLPLFGNGEKRTWYKNDHLKNGFVVSPTRYIQI